MNIQSTQIDLAKKLFNTVDTDALKQIASILNKKEIVAHTTSGKPLTRDEYIKEIKEAEQDIENGNYITSEQLLEDIKSW